MVGCTRANGVACGKEGAVSVVVPVLTGGVRKGMGGFGVCTRANVGRAEKEGRGGRVYSH